MEFSLLAAFAVASHSYNIEDLNTERNVEVIQSTLGGIRTHNPRFVVGQFLQLAYEDMKRRAWDSNPEILSDASFRD